MTTWLHFLAQILLVTAVTEYHSSHGNAQTGLVLGGVMLLTDWLEQTFEAVLTKYTVSITCFRWNVDGICVWYISGNFSAQLHVITFGKCSYLSRDDARLNTSD